jgi:DNA polymerase III delta subunit
MQGKAIIYRVQEYEGPLLAVVSADCSGKNSRIVALTSTCTPVQCAKMSEYGQEYAVWILAQARTMGYEFVDQAEDHLLRQVEPDMSLLSGELYKLWLYKGDNKTVSIADVNAVVSTVVSPSQFSLLDSIIRRDVVESLRVVAAYFRFGSDVVGLVVFLGVYFEKMYRLLLMQEKGMRPDEMAAMVAIPPYLIKTRYLPRATAWGRRRIGDFIDALCRLMTRLGTFQGDQSILVDALILNEIAAQK